MTERTAIAHSIRRNLLVRTIVVGARFRSAVLKDPLGRSVGIFFTKMAVHKALLKALVFFINS